MAQTAAILVDHVLPRTPYRQWVVTLPHPLHQILTWRSDLFRRVGRLCFAAVQRHLLHRSGRPAGALHRRNATAPLTGRPARWAQLAADEDEAVEAFRVHVEELRTLGAPASFVSRAVQAGADEERHRQCALDQASTLAGTRVELNPERKPASARRDPMAILASVAMDGALNETLSFCVISAEADACTDPEEAELLRQIAVDEAEHAALAWDTLVWVWPSLTPCQRETLARMLHGPPPRLRSLVGWLDEHALDRVMEASLREVVAPLRDLLTAP